MRILSQAGWNEDAISRVASLAVGSSDNENEGTAVSDREDDLGSRNPDANSRIGIVKTASPAKQNRLRDYLQSEVVILSLLNLAL